MKLVYYRGAVPNFGDDLNAALWPKLAPELFADGGADGAAFVGIGTIVGMPLKDAPRRLHVFSSGAGNDPPSRWADREVTWWCVRGPVSAEVLGLPADRALTDGAVLTPLAAGFPEAATGGGGVVVVPHWESLTVPGWDRVAAATGFEVVDPRGEVHGVIAALAGARLVLTESLHGAILADAYGVPWLAFATSRNFSVAKWVDWSRSLGRDLDLTLVPAPHPRMVARFGRRPEPVGQRLRFGLEAARAELAIRLDGGARGHGAAPSIKGRVRMAAADAPLVGALLGYTPERTAEALTALAQTEPSVSPPATVAALQARMLERLEALRRDRRPG